MKLKLLIAILSFAYTMDAQWQSADGPSGGQVNCLAVNNTNIFAGTAKGLFVSSDQGNSWSNIFVDSIENYFNYIAISDDKICVATDSTIFLSIDNGVTWKNIQKNIPNISISDTTSEMDENQVETLSIRKDDISVVNAIVMLDSKIYIATYGGVYSFSIGTNENWKLLNDSLKKVNNLFVYGSVFYAFTRNDDVLISKNQGVTWDKLKFSGKNWTNCWININGNCAIAKGTNEDGKAESIFSTDFGAKWEKIEKLPCEPQFFFEDETTFLLAEDGNIFCSDDKGKTWKKSYLDDANQFIKMGSDIFAASGNGVYRSSDGGNTWSQSSNGINYSKVSSIKNLDKGLVSFSNNKLWLYENEKWTDISSNLNVGMFDVNQTNIFAIVYDSLGVTSIFRSINKGANWECLKNGLPIRVIFKTIAVKNNTLLVSTDSLGIFRSTNNGDRWESISNGIKNKVLINEFTFCGENIYGKTNNGETYISKDNGNSWNVYTNLSALYISSLAENDNAIFALADNGIYVSKDKGASWFLSNLSKNTLGWSSIAAGTDIALAGNKYNDGVFSYRVADSSWVKAGLNNFGVELLSINGPNIFACTATKYTDNGTGPSSGPQIFLSIDKGKNWNSICEKIPGNHFLSLTNVDNKVLVQTDFGWFYTNNLGKSWTVLSGLAEKIFYQFSSFKNNSLGRDNNNLFYSSNSGATWELASEGLTGNISAVTLGENEAYCATDEGLFYKENNSPWKKMSNKLPKYDRHFAVMADNLIVGTSLGIWISNDNGNNWRSVQNYKNAKITSFVVKGDSVYAATAGKGVLISTDFGNTWNETNNGLTNHNISSLLIKGNYIFARANIVADNSGKTLIDGGIFRSSDNGKTWVSIYTGLTNSFYSGLILSGNVIFAPGNEELLFSSNYGDTWSKALFSGINYCVSLGKTILVSVYNGPLFLSSDLGTNWKEITKKIKIPPGYSYGFEPIVYGKDLLIKTLDAGTFLSQDGGNSWKLINKESALMTTVNGGRIIKSVSNKGLVFSDDGGKVWSPPRLKGQDIFSLFSQKEKIWAIGMDIFLSKDNGNSWVAISEGDPGRITSLTSKNNTLFAATETGNNKNGGIKYSIDKGKTWSTPKVKFQTKGAIKSFFVYNNLLGAATYSDSLFISNDMGNTWKYSSKEADNAKYTPLYYIPDTTTKVEIEGLSSFYLTDSSLFAITSGQGIYRSVDYGKIWNKINTGLIGLDIYSFASTDKTLFTSCYDYSSKTGGIFISSDNGTTWKAVNNGLTNLNVMSLTIRGENIFAKTTTGFFYSKCNEINWSPITVPTSNNLFFGRNTLIAQSIEGNTNHSRDNGNTWKDINPGSFSKKYFAMAVATNILYAGAANGLFSSVDNGKTWGIINDNSAMFIAAENNSVAFYNQDQNNFYVSKDRGKSWKTIKNTQYRYITSMQINNNVLYIGTRDQSVLKINLKG